MDDQRGRAFSIEPTAISTARCAFMLTAYMNYLAVGRLEELNKNSDHLGSCIKYALATISVCRESSAGENNYIDYY